MNKWEYYWFLMDFKKEDMDKIDELGLEGWELITIIPVKSKNSNNVFYGAVLKRPQSSEVDKT